MSDEKSEFEKWRDTYYDRLRTSGRVPEDWKPSEEDNVDLKRLYDSFETKSRVKPKGGFIQDVPMYSYTESNLTKRELFAAMVLQGFCSDRTTAEIAVEEKQSPHLFRAALAVEYADALIKALERGREI